jgi:hypothetical protein
MTPSHQFPISVKDHPEIRSDDLSYTNSEPVREEIEDNVVHDFHLVYGDSSDSNEEDFVEYNNFQLSVKNKIKKEFHDTLKTIVYFTFVFAGYVCYRLGCFSKPYMIRPPIRPSNLVNLEKQFEEQEHHLSQHQEILLDHFKQLHDQIRDATEAAI